MAFLRKHHFIACLLAAVALAFALPQLGAPDGPLHAGRLSKVGVMVIFFLQGLSLKTRELADGLIHWRLHLFIQSWIFLLSPVVLFAAGGLMSALGNRELAQGFFYLGLIPTTISSAVAFTTTAHGNVASAIFNTTLSNVAGVFWVPLGCLLIFSTSGGLPTGLILPLLTKLAWLILLPLLAGQLLRPLVRNRSAFKSLSPGFKHINNGIILFIVFTAFCKSVLNNVWGSVTWPDFALLMALVAVSVVAIHAGVWISSCWACVRTGDRLTALFCGSQKTLAAGAPMAVAIFDANAGLEASALGLILLPLLIYHPMQLFLAAILLPRLPRP